MSQKTMPETASNHRESARSGEDQALRDQFGRPMKSLRLSVTDRCNLACTYCMPEGGPDTHSDADHILDYEELTELASVFVDLGVDNVRITGGEPLLRSDLHHLVEQLVTLDGLEEVSLTTNGYYLAEQIDDLVAAGLDRINFSLDTLREDRFREITRRRGYDRVRRGLRSLLNRPELEPVKLNVVAIRGFNDDEILDFTDWAIKHQAHVRFIEFMPLEKGYSWEQEKVILASEIRERVEEHHDLESVDKDPHAPSTTYEILGTGAYLGFIPSVSNPFCDTCDRVRITADGQVKNCLFAYEEDDLRETLRNGGDQEDLREIIRSNYRRKWEGGCAKLAKGEYDPEKISRTMSRVGG